MGADLNALLDSHHAAPAALLVGTAAVMTLLAATVWRRREASNDLYLVVVLLATAIWAGAHALEVTDVGRHAEMWGELKYVGVCLLAPAWVGFVLAYTGRRNLLRPALWLALAVEPTIVLVLLAGPGTETLIRVFPEGTTSRPPVASAGPLFWPHFVYTSLVLWGALALLLASLSRVPHVHRRRMRLVAVSLVVPWVFEVLYAGEVKPFKSVDFTPFVLLLSELVLLWGVEHLPSLEVLGVPRSRVFETVDSPVIVLDRLLRIVDANPAAQMLLAGPLPAVVGMPVASAAPAFANALDEGGVTVGSPGEVEVGGTVYDVSAAPLTDRQGRRTGILLAAHDVTERKAAEREHERRSLHDALTGLPNRELLMRRLRHLSHAGGEPDVGLLFVDVDDFKSVNDTHGHRIGDAVLVEVARRLRAGVREGDLVARIGGDEFVILVEDADGEQLPIAIAEHVVTAFRRPVRVEGHQVTVHVSVGVSFTVDAGVEALIDRADEAMYRAKARGHDYVELSMPAQRIDEPPAERDGVRRDDAARP